MVSGPEMAAPACPAPSALLHPNGVRSVRTKQQSAAERMRWDEFMIDAPLKDLLEKPVMSPLQ
jgi:hypothetical protein